MDTLQSLPIPKAYLKKKKLYLYKAFILNDGDEMQIHTDIDILSLDLMSAIQFLVANTNVTEVLELTGKTINFAAFEFITANIINQPLIDEGEVYFQDLSLAITLKDKKYNISVEDRLIENIEIEVDAKTEIKMVKNITLLNMETGLKESYPK